jgi:CRISPR-associated protein Cmr2
MSSSTQPSYIALTIGPIYQTLLLARATRELWGASYLFSYIMGNIIKNLQEEGITSEQILIPYYSNENSNEPLNHYGAGVFPDRLIFRKNKGDEAAKLNRAIEKTLNEVSCIMISCFQKNNIEVKEKSITAYIKQYFRFCIVEKTLKANENAIIALTPYLDTLELQCKVVPKEEEQESTNANTKRSKANYLELFFENINSSKLFKETFKQVENEGKYKHIDGFPSIVDIATIGLYENHSELFAQNNGGEEEGIYTKLKNNKDLMPYHRYICIVHADGDNIGETIKAINENNFTGFSKKLYDFAIWAAKEISNYGGKPLYIGGDDLLFLAPVCAEGSSIFELMDSIQKKFANSGFGDGVSLSLGLSITYHKFPMFEALEMSRNLLFEKAKSSPKNALAFRIQKHSGQWWEATLHKKTGEEGQLYTHFIEKIGKIHLSEASLQSLIYKLRDNQSLLHHIWQKRETDSNPFIHFFTNFFNETIHQGDTEKYIEYVSDLLWICYKTFDKEEDTAMKTYYALLRTIQFLSSSSS